MIDPTIVTEAVRIIGGERQDAYGAPEDNFARIAGMWTAYLGVPVSPADVGQMMVLLKVARSRHAYKRDNAVDAVAYALLADALGRPCE